MKISRILLVVFAAGILLTASSFFMDNNTSPPIIQTTTLSSGEPQTSSQLPAPASAQAVEKPTANMVASEPQIVKSVILEPEKAPAAAPVYPPQIPASEPAKEEVKQPVKSPEKQEEPATVVKILSAPKISPEEAKKAMEGNPEIILVDVRTQEERDSKYIPGSIHIPLNTLPEAALAQIPDKNSTIYLYCLSGGRSAEAGKRLLAEGYTKVWNMGGISAWPYETIVPAKDTNQ